MYRWINKIALLGLVLTMSISSHAAEMDKVDRHFVYPSYSKRVSMDFKDAALVDVLKVFSKQSGMNFIASQDVNKKRVTLFLENIPMEEALDQILKANSLTYEMQDGSDIFFVKESISGAKKIITKIYPLKYATVPTSKLNKTITIGASSGSTGISDAIKAVLTSAGKVVEDTRTNSLIITDEEAQFVRIDETIAMLDVPIPQILIEVEMLDVAKGATDKIGIKYGDTPISMNGSKSNTLFPFARDINQQALMDKAYLAQPTYTIGTIDSSGLTAQLQFLKTRSDTKNLARPRLLTLNNETAELKISTNEAIGVKTTTNTGTITTAQSEPERVQTGVFLTVTPQANLLTGEIVMAVYPKVIQASQSQEFPDFKDPEERGSQSILKVKDGETIVIGGLLRRSDTNTITKIPFLGDIPLLGGAFRHKQKVENERELIIFITPHIVTDNNKEYLAKKDAMFTKRSNNNPIHLDEIDKALSTIERQRF